MGDKPNFRRTTVANAKAQALKARAARAQKTPNEKKAVSANRTLRVSKWLSSTPAMGVCSSCNQEFRERRHSEAPDRGIQWIA